MLFEVSVSLAARCDVLTSVARTEKSLRSLDAAVACTTAIHHMLRLDWSESDEFFRTLRSHAREVGSPSLVVAWLHEESLAPRLARAVLAEGVGCDFYHVRSSMASVFPRTDWSHQIPASVVYHQIILGFCVESGRSRWLRDSEISAGVLAAIERRDVSTVIGTVKPWEARPS